MAFANDSFISRKMFSSFYNLEFLTMLLVNFKIFCFEPSGLLLPIKQTAKDMTRFALDGQPEQALYDTIYSRLVCMLRDQTTSSLLIVSPYEALGYVTFGDEHC